MRSVTRVAAVTGGVGGAPVTEADAAFGYSRPAYHYPAAALELTGLEGLVTARPGSRGAHKLTEQILAWAGQRLAADPGLRPAERDVGGTYGIRRR